MEIPKDRALVKDLAGNHASHFLSFATTHHGENTSPNPESKWL